MKRILSSRYVELAASSLLLLGTISFWMFRRSFLVSNETSLLLSGLIIFFAISVFALRKSIYHSFQFFFKDNNKIFVLICSILMILSILAIFSYLFSILILKEPYLARDEWNNFNRIILSQSTWDAIFTNYNGHPSYLINALYVSVLEFFNCDNLVFNVINASSLLSCSWIFFRITLSQKKSSTSPILLSAFALIMALMGFWFPGSIHPFWNVPYLQLFAGVLSIYGLSLYVDRISIRGLCVFFIGASMLSVSFGNGILTWVLGLLSALLISKKLPQSIPLIIVSIVGIALSYWAINIQGSLNRTFDVLSVLKAIPIFLGGSIVSPFVSGIAPDNLAAVYNWTGLIGIVSAVMILGFLVYRKKFLSQQIVFAFLLMLFSIGTCALIAFGRLNDEVLIVASNRYKMWSILYWLALVMMIFQWLQHFKNKAIKEYSTIILLVSVFVYTVYNNQQALEKRLVSYNISVRSLLDLIVSPDRVGNEVLTWRPNSKSDLFRKKVLDVNSALKSESLGPYKKREFRSLGLPLDFEMLQLGVSINATVSYGNDSENYYMELSLNKDDSSTTDKPRVIYILQDSKLVGFALPYSDILRSRSEILGGGVLTNPTNTLWGHYPGMSSFYFGQFKLDAPNSKNLSLIAELVNGTLVQIVSN